VVHGLNCACFKMWEQVLGAFLLFWRPSSFGLKIKLEQFKSVGLWPQYHILAFDKWVNHAFHTKNFSNLAFQHFFS
jgi:hypothetical protein